MATSSSEDKWAALRAPFPASQVGILPRTNKRPELEYVGHGAVTARLLDVDPEWTWTPIKGPDGMPLIDRDQNGQPVGLWINLTVNGVTRCGYGDCDSGQFSAMKVLIGDALRNAAMRFGVALDLWVKGHAEDDEKFRGSVANEPPPPAPVLTPEEQEAADYREMIWQKCADLKKLDVEGGHYITTLREAAGTTKTDIQKWIAADPDEANLIVTGLVDALKNERANLEATADGPGVPDEPEPPKPPKAPRRAKPGSAVES